MEDQALIGDCEVPSWARTIVSESNEPIRSYAGYFRGRHLLSSSTYRTEFSILEEMWKNLVHYLRLMIYGFNDTTIPPV